MKTFDSGTIDRQTVAFATVASTTIAPATIAHTTIAPATIALGGRSKLFEVELLAGGGIAAEVAYEGDATGCPHCICRVLSDAREALAPDALAPEIWAA